MQIPIPQDWDGESWQCYQIQWPDSPTYRALLIGFITYLQRGRTYDGRTGRIIDAQAIGREITARNISLIACQDTPDCPDCPTPPEPIIYYNFSEEESEDCMGCNPCLRWNNGILEMLSCGEWVAVPGNAPTVSSPPPGGIDDPTVPQPGDDPDVDQNIKCRVAWMIAHAMWRVHERILDYIDDLIAIPFIGEKVAHDLPEYTLDKLYVARATASIILAGAGADWDAIFAEENNYVADMAAWMEKFLPEKYALSQSDFNKLGFGLELYSFHEGLEVSNVIFEGIYWANLLVALGLGTVNELAAQARTLSSEEYDCQDHTVLVLPPPTPPGNGAWWSGLAQKDGLDGSIEVVSLSSNMRKINLRWAVPSPGQQFTDLEASIGLVVPVNLTSLTMVVSGEFPLRDWHSLPYNRGDNPHIPSLAGVTNIHNTSGPLGGTEVTWTITFDAGKPTAYLASSTNSFRFLPQDTRPDGGICEWSIEITDWA